MKRADFSAVRALVFDLDGTLIDSKKDLVTAVNLMLVEMGRGELPEEIVASYVGSGAVVLVSRALGGNASESEVKRALEIFLARYEEHKLDVTRAYPGTEEMLRNLDGYERAVLTNKPTKISVRILDELGLSRHFRVIYGGNSFETKKPDPLGAKTILREFGVAPHEAVMVGDSEVDVQTARNAGMMSATVNFGFGTHDREKFPSDVYLESFEDLVALVKNGARRG